MFSGNEILPKFETNRPKTQQNAKNDFNLVLFRVALRPLIASVVYDAIARRTGLATWPR